ncbi:MAG: hypothetical protein ACKVWR_19505 [Acidimicrobiales bacterium]
MTPAELAELIELNGDSNADRMTDRSAAEWRRYYYAVADAAQTMTGALAERIIALPEPPNHKQFHKFWNSLTDPSALGCFFTPEQALRFIIGELETWSTCCRLCEEYDLYGISPVTDGYVGTYYRNGSRLHATSLDELETKLRETTAKFTITAQVELEIVATDENDARAQYLRMMNGDRDMWRNRHGHVLEEAAWLDAGANPRWATYDDDDDEKVPF